MGDSSHDRRTFFREFLSRYVAPVADYVEERLDAVVPKPRLLLRPPGALAERDFLETCYRCGSCMDACPADAIALLKGAGESLNGTPYVDPERQPCVVCDGLVCMQACPSGALQKVPLEQIRMGVAVVHLESCVRSQGDECRRCVDLCPAGEKAIRLDGNGHVEVLQEGCVGCGVCQHACPASPKAIVVGPL